MQTTTGLIWSIQVGLPEQLHPDRANDPAQNAWTTGIFKRTVTGPVRLHRLNLEGDGQADLVHHGGPDKAVCVYPSEHWFHWHGILPPHQLTGGAFGENFTLQGLTEDDVCIGDVYSVGSAVVQISQPRQPCWKLARRWHRKDLALQIEQTGFTGWYFRVLHEGIVETNAILRLQERPCPEWTIATANQIMHRERENRTAAEHLSRCPLLSSSWQQTLRQRAHNQAGADPEHRRLGDSQSE
ncbi:MAG: MOSC domain-containing protein [Nitrospira sp.]|nr:MOSC domain-containing protein [Nitrospira sp.]